MSSNIQDLTGIVGKHPLFADLDPAHLELVAGCASNVKFEPGEQILHEGQPADRFYLIRYGRVSVEVFAPGRGRITIQTLHPNDVLGWSWIVEPYRWHHDATALDLTRALAFDGACLRKKSEDDPAFGYAILKRFAPLIAKRLERAQLQLLDVYGHAIAL